MRRNLSDWLGDRRARLTPVDVVFFGTALFALSLLADPWYQVLNDNADSMGTGAAYLFKLIFPALVLTIMAVIYLTGATGGGAAQ